MFDQEDEGTRIGVTVALAIVFVVVFGLIAGLMLRQLGQHRAPAAAVAAPAASAAFIDLKIEGDPLGSIYFASGKSDLPDGVEPVVIKVALAAIDDGKRRVLVSGFHDASGSAEVNAELAKQRALSVRAALIAEGLPAERVVLRKPEVTLGEGDAMAARRVDIHLVD